MAMSSYQQINGNLGQRVAGSGGATIVLSSRHCLWQCGTPISKVLRYLFFPESEFLKRASAGFRLYGALKQGRRTRTGRISPLLAIWQALQWKRKKKAYPNRGYFTRLFPAFLWSWRRLLLIVVKIWLRRIGDTAWKRGLTYHLLCMRNMCMSCCCYHAYLGRAYTA